MTSRTSPSSQPLGSSPTRSRVAAARPIKRRARPPRANVSYAATETQSSLRWNHYASRSVRRALLIRLWGDGGTEKTVTNQDHKANSTARSCVLHKQVRRISALSGGGSGRFRPTSASDTVITIPISDDDFMAAMAPSPSGRHGTVPGPHRRSVPLVRRQRCARCPHERSLIGQRLPQRDAKRILIGSDI